MWKKICLGIGSMFLFGMLACNDSTNSGKNGRDAMSASGRAIGILEMDEALNESDTIAADSAQTDVK